MEEIKVISFTFTPGQLFKLLTETIELYGEYVEQHEYIPECARVQAANDTIDGLTEAQWLIDHEELEPHSGQIYP